MTLAKRLKAMGSAKYQNDGDPVTSGPGFGITEHPDTLSLPLGWRKPRLIFVDSMSDLFHKGVSDEFIAQVWAVMAACPQHTFQVLTKRHGRMRSLMNSAAFWEQVMSAASALGLGFVQEVRPLDNVWLGVSVEDQKTADLRIPALLATPAAVRFLSCEPLLGPVDLFGPGPCCEDMGPAITHEGVSTRTDYGTGIEWDCDHQPGIDWVIIGGESGPGARPMDLDWARSLIHQCRETAPVFVKQLGSVFGPRKGGDMESWPKGLRVREWPNLPGERVTIQPNVGLFE